MCEARRLGVLPLPPMESAKKKTRDGKNRRGRTSQLKAKIGRNHTQKLFQTNNPILPEHKPYDMRTTFETRCDECGIEDRAIGLFMGNNIGKDKKDVKLKKAYTDITDADYLNYLFQEGQKLNY